jgi:Na+-translocating ferredoxin:NAD+ oxidoreductase subunit C
LARASLFWHDEIYSTAIGHEQKFVSGSSKSLRGGYLFRRFEGAAKSVLIELPVPEHISIPLDHSLIGSCVPAVKDGDTVRAGETLLSGPDGSWSMTAPLSGTVSLAGDGVLRIEGNRSPGFVPVPGHVREPWLLGREELFGQFARTGAGLLFGNRFRVAADCDAIRRIVINTVQTSPLNNGWSPELYGAQDLASRGLKILHALFPSAELILTATRKKADVVLPENATASVRILSDKFPQEHPSLIAREICSGAAAETLLVCEYTDIVQLAETLCLGRPLIDRIVCIAGPGVSRPAWYRVRIGTSIEDIVKKVGKDAEFGPWRVIWGNPLSGKAAESAGEPLMFGTREISIISNRAERKLMAFLSPGFTADSYTRSTVSAILPLFPRTVETATHGGVRPCVQCNFCDEVCPMGLYPFLIWKYMNIDKPGETARLQPERCIECGLCDYVCPSKIAVVDSVRRAREALSKGETE